MRGVVGLVGILRFAVKLYLKNGRALSRKPGSLLFGDCRCGFCCPRYGVFGSARVLSASSAASRDAHSQLTYYTYSEGAFVPVTISRAGGARDGGALVSMRKKTPCGIVDTQGSYSIEAFWTGYFGPAASATIVGVPIGNHTFRLLVGMMGKYYQADDPYTVSTKCDWKCFTRDMSWMGAGDSCAQIIIKTGGATGYSTVPAPGDIPLGNSVTIPPGVRSDAPQIITDTLSAIIPAGADETNVSWWFEADFWLDPAYGQGLINP